MSAYDAVVKIEGGDNVFVTLGSAEANDPVLLVLAATFAVLGTRFTWPLISIECHQYFAVAATSPTSNLVLFDLRSRLLTAAEILCCIVSSSSQSQNAGCKSKEKYAPLHKIIHTSL